MMECGKIAIYVPKPGSCPICGANHPKYVPHDRDSLIFLVSFYRRHGRFPTWADAAVKSEQIRRNGR